MDELGIGTYDDIPKVTEKIRKYLAKQRADSGTRDYVGFLDFVDFHGIKSEDPYADIDTKRKALKILGYQTLKVKGGRESIETCEDRYVHAAYKRALVESRKKKRLGKLSKLEQ